MLILAKAMMAIMLGFISSIFCGVIFIPLLKKMHVGQVVSKTISMRHLKKEGTPTMGGIIFVFPVIVSLIALYFMKSISISYNLIIMLFVFISYALLGFVDDYLKIKHKNNAGLSIPTKFLIQMFIALIFFILFMKGGGSSVLQFTFLKLRIPLGWSFGLFIFVLLVGTSNAVNITDGLDGLCAGLSVIAFLAYGIIAWNCSWLPGYQEIAIFAFILSGALVGFLMFNSHPAKVFMGDLGSLALGSTLATMAILTRHEMSLAIIGGVFLIEVLSSLIQIIAIRKFGKRVFLKAPIHHHFEELNWAETDIIRLFWTVGLILAMIAITYGVWL
ncbi:MAG: phospho-N-acetylmuramoyl-pentapeptide-transferase [Mollicutes bacterium]|nr:phospho-N-acetylmuramoyl-pentapeptide-transferase [Mollicutes bacterium]